MFGQTESTGQPVRRPEKWQLPCQWSPTGTAEALLSPSGNISNNRSQYFCSNIYWCLRKKKRLNRFRDCLRITLSGCYWSMAVKDTRTERWICQSRIGWVTRPRLDSTFLIFHIMRSTKFQIKTKILAAIYRLVASSKEEMGSQSKLRTTFGKKIFYNLIYFYFFWKYQNM